MSNAIDLHGFIARDLHGFNENDWKHFVLFGLKKIERNDNGKKFVLFDSVDYPTQIFSGLPEWIYSSTIRTVNFLVDHQFAAHCKNIFDDIELLTDRRTPSIFSNPLQLYWVFGRDVISCDRKFLWINLRRRDQVPEQIVVPLDNFTEPRPLGRIARPLGIRSKQVFIQHDLVDGIDLCDDVLFDILTRIPARILHRSMRCVCKKWFRMISDPLFVDAHLSLSRSGMLVEDKGSGRSTRSNIMIVGSDGQVQSRFAASVIVLGSCNGLLLIVGLNTDQTKYTDGRVAIFNPATTQLSILRPLPLFSSSCIRATDVGGGIGFNPVTKEYKIVFFFRHISEANWICNILTVGEGHWRRVYGFSLSRKFCNRCFQSVLLNSSHLNWLIEDYRLHWLMSDDERSELDCHIITLDVTSRDDRFGRIELDKKMKKGNDLCLMEMRGSLAVSLLSRHYGIAIWVVDADKIWTKLIALPYDWSAIGVLQSTSRSSTLLEEEEEVLIFRERHDNLWTISYFAKDMKHDTVERLTTCFLTDDDLRVLHHSAYAHVDSLVSWRATNY